MRRNAVLLAIAIASAVALAAEQAIPPVADLVAKLRTHAATYEDWRPVLDAGKAAVPDLKKLLSDPSDTVRATAAVLLYRLGEASALDTLAALLGSKDEDARREAASALQAFVGRPTDFDPAAPEAERAKALAAWQDCWKKDRAALESAPTMSSVYGRIVTVDPDGTLVVVSLSEKYGAARGMRLYVRRGDDFVCLLEVVMVDAKGSVARIVDLSARSAPTPGDTVFWTKR